jgi:hypothetical protein
MAIDFPSSPSLNQVYTFDDKSWYWNGSGWASVAPVYVGNRDYGLITGSVTGTLDYGALV